MHGPYRGWTLDKIRQLPLMEIKEWFLAYQRCPWGPKIDDLRHVQLIRLQTTSDFDVNALRLDKTGTIYEQLERDIAGVIHNEAIDIDAEAEKQSQWLEQLQKIYG